MELHLLENRADTGWAEFGGCWGRGETRCESFVMTDSQGRSVPVQSSVTARWPDGSVRWSRHTARADLLGQHCRLTPAEEAAPVSHPLQVEESDSCWTVRGQRISLRVPKAGSALFEALTLDGSCMVRSAEPVLSLAHEEETAAGCVTRSVVPCPAAVTRRELEESGPLQLVFRFDGVHLEQGCEKMPFRVRLYIRDDGNVAFDHTFFFQGDPERDRLASLGLRFAVPLEGTGYQRHVRFLTDQAVCHDLPTQLIHWKRRLGRETMEACMRGETLPATPDLDAAAAEVPCWSRFLLLQDSAQHCVYQKKTSAEKCWVEGMHGHRAPGACALSDTGKTVAVAIRDFWEKHPAALEAAHMEQEEALCTAWFYAPQAQPFDFRHYDTRMYVQSCYEGFEYIGADPNGIAVTSRCELSLAAGWLPDEALSAFAHAVRKPAVYTAEPAWYHERQAFGIWGLRDASTEMAEWIERQIDAACDFYRKEVEARSWYGLFNYGDFMHTYEAAKHQWRYDVGGYAWDNTELAPTYWLWLQFLRTGSEQVFSLAEALSRHTEDVDMYHFGPLKGLGSRHNVRHWGCSCKEPRVSMPGHHRPLYYLTGSRRAGDCMEDALNAEFALRHTGYYPQADGTLRLRTGPDWASLVSGWMTAYERTLDEKWLKKIQAGLDGIEKAPLRLTSGPDFAFEEGSGGMRYLGEADHPTSMHLQACMAEPEVWLETAMLTQNEKLADMVASNGRYYYLPQEEREAESKGLLRGRSFGGVIYSADMQAYYAVKAGDEPAKKDIWRRLLGLLYRPDRPEGFKPVPYGSDAQGAPLWEIPWVTTNFTAQWCLKAIFCLGMMPEALPATLSALSGWLQAAPAPDRLYGA